ncbi:DUF3574 domain-containing protein [Inquilinus sp. NPDC058860]|uniref:DUF3574 domain-containing protein n=1 Tax=Inquilinus sp. NPDC058860 TaxID=3346652 RepID=UPI0036B81140
MATRFGAALICAALLTGTMALAQDDAQTVPALCRTVGGTGSLEAELLFGRNIQDKGTVSDSQWSDFLGREVTPRFPDGLTVFEASGQWRDGESGRIVHEPSWIVMILAPNTPDTLARLSEIRTAYKARFQQQSVGLTLSQTCVDF